MVTTKKKSSIWDVTTTTNCNQTNKKKTVNVITQDQCVYVFFIFVIIAVGFYDQKKNEIIAKFDRL